MSEIQPDLSGPMSGIADRLGMTTDDFACLIDATEQIGKAVLREENGLAFDPSARIPDIITDLADPENVAAIRQSYDAHCPRRLSEAIELRVQDIRGRTPSTEERRQRVFTGAAALFFLVSPRARRTADLLRKAWHRSFVLEEV